MKLTCVISVYFWVLMESCDAEYLCLQATVNVHDIVHSIIICELDT